jgi:PAS domain S-box-containing protein
LSVNQAIAQHNIYQNGQVIELLGYTSEEIQAMGNQLLSQLMHPEDLVRLREHFERLNLTQPNKILGFEYRMRRVDGQWRWFYSRDKVFRRTPDGRLHKIIGVAQDITDRKQAEIDLQIANERFELAAAAVNCLIYDWDLQNGRVERTCGLTQILGYSLEEAEPTAQWWQELVNPQDFAKVNSGEAWENFASNGRYCDQYRVRHQNGNYIWVEDRGIAVKDNDGNIIRIIGTTTDISDRKKAEIELQESAERLKLAQSAANAGCWDWDIVNNRVTWSEEYYDLYGLDSTILPSYQNWLDSIREEDREQADRQVREAIEQQSEINIEFRIQHPIKGIRWLNAIGSTFYNPEGKPIQMIGITFLVDLSDRKHIEETLQEKEQQLRLALEAADMVAYRWDIASDRAIQSPNVDRVFGLPLGTTIQTGTEFFSLIHPEDRERVIKAIDDAIAGRQDYRTEFRLVCPDGNVRWMADRGWMSFDRSGTKAICLRGVIFDITARKESELLLSKNVAILNAINNATSTLIFAKDLSGKVIVANPATISLIGKPESEIIGYTDLEFLSDREQAERMMSNDRRVMETGQIEVFEETLDLPEGKRTFLTTKSPYRDKAGNIIGVIGVATDITKRKQTQQKLAQQAQLLDLADEGIFVRDLNSRITYWNHGAEQMYGWTSKEAIGQVSYTLLKTKFAIAAAKGGSEETHSSFSGTDLNAILLQTGHWEGELIHTRRNGEQITIDSRQILMRDEQGNPTGILQVNRDITERKRIEIALRQNEERLRSFFEANVIGVIYGDVYGNIHTANDEFLRIVGYSREVLEAGGLSWINITPPEYLPLDRERVAEARATGACTPYEKEYIRADGSRVPVLVGYGLVGEAREESVAFVLDLSDRKQAESKLRESEERLRLATTGADLGMWFWYLPKNELIWTDKCKALFGLSLDTQISYEVFLNCLHPDDRDRTHEAVNRSLAEKIDYDIEYRTVWLDGSIHWIAARAKGFYDEQGNAIRMMGTAQDITARKQAEEERAELLVREQAAREESERANRVKDEFLAILSHELRSPLNPILGWTQMLQTYQFDADKIKQGITTIDRNAKLLNQLIDDLLDVNRILRGKLTLNVASVNLAFAIEAAIETVRNAAIAKSISIQTNLLPVGKVSGDSGRLQQIVGNLLSNAVKFTPNGGCIEIKLEQIEQGSRGAEEQGSRGAGKNAGSSISSASGPLSPSAPQPLGLSAYSYAKITVSDTGKGIASEFLPYIFEHFRQADASVTRNHGGLGLGLAIVRYLVELHGGEVIAESLGVDRGATFTVTLPLLNEQPESNEQDDLSNYELDLTGVRVLVVDDEPDTREFLAIALEQYQAEVMAVSSAREVSSSLRTFQPHILVSDIGMPGIDGYTLLRSIRSLPSEQGGQIPAIALTAYAREEDSQQALSAGFQVHLAKPIEPHLLAETIFLLSC